MIYESRTVLHVPSCCLSLAACSSICPSWIWPSGDFSRMLRTPMLSGRTEHMFGELINDVIDRMRSCLEWWRLWYSCVFRSMIDRSIEWVSVGTWIGHRLLGRWGLGARRLQACMPATSTIGTLDARDVRVACRVACEKCLHA